MSDIFREEVFHMSQGFPIIYRGGIGQITEKKSKFIATVYPIGSEEEATLYLEQIRKKYYDATHHCFAYVLGDKQNIQRCSDDGEPSGTAGRPMLDVILGEDLHNVLVVVTRYFGGTLLGTGGLVKAYSNATKEGIACSTILFRQPGKKIRILTDYVGIGKLQYIVAQMQLTILDTIYTDAVELLLMVPVGDVDAFVKQVTEVTSGQAKIQELGQLYYGTVDGTVVFVD